MTTEKTAEELGITEYDAWCIDLAEYACTWIIECQNKIIMHAHEIFENRTLREMVSTYARAKNEADKSERREFIRACISGQEIPERETYDHIKKDSYKHVLDDMIWDRYCRDVTRNA